MEDRFPHDVVCLYHKNCLDGLAAAWVVWKYYQGRLNTVAVQYGDKFDEMFGEGFEALIGKKVVCVDFAFDLKTTKQLAGICDLIVLDHHDTAQRDLESIAYKSAPAAMFDLLDDKPGPFIVVDNRNSGARLAWNWFFGMQDTVPAPIKYVEDYDLWRFNYSVTKAWVAAAFSGEMTPEHFDTYVSFDFHEQAKIIERMELEGKAIQRHIDKTVKGLSKSARRFRLDAYDVPIVNANSVFRNELGALLAVNEPFSVSYTDHRDGRQYSLRSKKDGVHVGDIAKRFGGGGHANSAAFRIHMDDEQFHNSHLELSSVRTVKNGNEWVEIPRYAKEEA